MWQSQPADLPLLDDEVHVWRADLSVPEDQFLYYQRSLSEDEIVRAKHLQNPLHRRRFVVRRGILRCLLSYYLDVEPTNIAFAYTAYGKPMLRVRDARSALRFTVSHASNEALYAVSQHRNIGIDIEHLQYSFDYEQIASNLFATEENALLRALPLPERSAAFFRLWTCKEAYVKAWGLGLSLSLNTFAVLLDSSTPARLLYGHQQMGASYLSLRELSIDDKCAAALAVEGNDCYLRYWQYSV